MKFRKSTTIPISHLLKRKFGIWLKKINIYNWFWKKNTAPIPLNEDNSVPLVKAMPNTAASEQ